MFLFLFLLWLLLFFLLLFLFSVLLLLLLLLIFFLDRGSGDFVVPRVHPGSPRDTNMKSHRHEAAGGVLHQKLTTLLYQSLLRLRVLGEGGPQRLLGQDEQVRVAHAADVCRASVSVLVSCSAQQTDRQTDKGVNGETSCCSTSHTDTSV